MRSGRRKGGADLTAVEEAPATGATRRRILTLARAHGLTAYDAAYVELAQRLGVKLFTLNQAILGLRRVFNWIE